MAAAKDVTTVIVTGGTSGIGLQAAMLLLEEGARVIVTGRTAASVAGAVTKLSAVGGGGSVSGQAMDMTSLVAVQRCARRLRDSLGHVDLVLCNAGWQGVASSGVPQRTREGVESTVGINHLAHVLFVRELWPLIEASAERNRSAGLPRVRITVVSSDLHDPDTPTGSAKMLGRRVDAVDPADLGLERQIRDGTFDSTTAYKHAKLLNAMHGLELNTRLADAGIHADANTVDPGFIPTSGLARENGACVTCLMSVCLGCLFSGCCHCLFGQPVRTLRDGARSELFALREGPAGRFFHLDEVRPAAAMAEDGELRARVMDGSVAMLAGLGFMGPPSPLG